MVVKCEIQFTQNSQGIYLVGQYLSGRVTLTVDKPKTVKSFAQTSWQEATTETSSNDEVTKSTTKDYGGFEEYLKYKTCLLGDEETQSVVLEPGVHNFNFGCNIPKTCPTSFEGTHGCIRYTVNVMLVRPWKFDQTFTKAFTVMRVMDLNYGSPQLRTTASRQVQTTFCCDLCGTEPVKLHLTLPQSGYVSGQNIPVCLIVTNDSDVLILEIKVSLVMLICYFCDDNIATETERLIVTKHQGESVQKYCKKLFNYLLHVPATPATSMTHCRLIQVSYQVEAVARFQGMHANQVLCTPLTIGNVPLSSVIVQQPTGSVNRTFEVETPKKQDAAVGSELHEKAATTCSASSSSQSPELPWAAEANIPPPSYEKAAHMITVKLNMGDSTDSTDFAPLYPVFQTDGATASTSIQIEDNRWKHSLNVITDIVADAISLV